MSETSDEGAQKPDIAEGEAKAAKEKDPIPRHVYVTLRLEEISTQIRKMIATRKAISEQLKGVEGDGQKKFKQLRDTRSYIGQRLMILREEQVELNREKKTFAGAQREGGGKGGAKKEKKLKAGKKAKEKEAAAE